MDKLPLSKEYTIRFSPSFYNYLNWYSKKYNIKRSILIRNSIRFYINYLDERRTHE